MQQDTRLEQNGAHRELPSAFFVAGGTLSRDAASYVTRKADADLLAGLRQGQFCYVLTSRQMGKSSLMVRAATQLRQEGVAVAVLDLTAIGQNLTPEQWYDGLLNRIGRQLNLEDELDDFWIAQERMGPLTRFLRALKEVILGRITGPVVIFVDEVDAVRSLPFSTDEFFAGIRECYNSRVEELEMRRLTFALFGVASPSDLIRDTRTTPFNIGVRIELKDFTPQEAAPLANALGSRQGDGETRRLGDKEKGKRQDNSEDPNTLNSQLGRPPAEREGHTLNRILYWTGGHPYLTQRLCQAISILAEESPQTKIHTRDVDRLCRTLFLASRSREMDDNLLFVRERLLRSEVDRAMLLDLYAQVRAGRRVADEETNPLVSVLHLAGIVRVEQGRLHVRNRIYAYVFDNTWVRNNMPDAISQMRKAAYRLGQLRTGAVSGVILLLLSVTTVQSVYLMRANADLKVRNAQNDVKRAEQSKQLAQQNALLASDAEVESRTHEVTMLMARNNNAMHSLLRKAPEHIMARFTRPHSARSSDVALSPSVRSAILDSVSEKNSQQSASPAPVAQSLPPQVTASAPTVVSDKLYPDLQQRTLALTDIQNWSKGDITLALNEIYAKHGYKFKEANLLKHFQQYAWYKPTTRDEDAVVRRFNAHELANVLLLDRARKGAL